MDSKVVGPSNFARVDDEDKDVKDRLEVPTRPKPHSDSSKQRLNLKRRPHSHRGGRTTRQKRPRQTHTNLGYFGSVPSLHKENGGRKQTNKRSHPKSYHSRQGFRPNPIPVLGPPSAPGPAQFPGADANLTETPTLAGTVAGGMNNGADKLQEEGLQENLDFYATNAGLVFYDNTPLVSSSDGELNSPSVSGALSDSAEGDEGKVRRDATELRPQSRVQGRLDTVENPGDGTDLRSKIIRRLRTRISEQDAYITQLEDDNLRLQERLDLARQQLKDLLTSHKS